MKSLFSLDQYPKLLNLSLYQSQEKRKSIKISSYGKRLAEWRKLRSFYGDTCKKVLQALYKKAYFPSRHKKQRNNLSFFRKLESRLDVVLYRSAFFETIASAKQEIVLGRICVNNEKVFSPAYSLVPGDIIRVFSTEKQGFPFAPSSFSPKISLKPSVPIMEVKGNVKQNSPKNLDNLDNNKIETIFLKKKRTHNIGYGKINIKQSSWRFEKSPFFISLITKINGLLKKSIRSKTRPFWEEGKQKAMLYLKKSDSSVAVKAHFFPFSLSFDLNCVFRDTESNVTAFGPFPSLLSSSSSPILDFSCNFSKANVRTHNAFGAPYGTTFGDTEGLARDARDTLPYMHNAGTQKHITQLEKGASRADATPKVFPTARAKLKRQTFGDTGTSIECMPRKEGDVFGYIGKDDSATPCLSVRASRMHHRSSSLTNQRFVRVSSNISQSDTTNYLDSFFRFPFPFISTEENGGGDIPKNLIEKKEPLFFFKKDGTKKDIRNIYNKNPRKEELEKKWLDVPFLEKYSSFLSFPMPLSKVLSFVLAPSNDYFTETPSSTFWHLRWLRRPLSFAKRREVSKQDNTIKSKKQPKMEKRKAIKIGELKQNIICAVKNKFYRSNCLFSTFLLFLKMKNKANNVKANCFIEQKHSSFFKRQSFFIDKTEKPLHLEISYKTLCIVFLYPPQRLSFPKPIDLWQVYK